MAEDAADAADAREVKLPRVSAVEVPGRVKDVEEAVAAVGGRKAVADAIADRARLRLRLCRSYQFQAPMPMKRYRTSDLLVKARKKPDGTWDCPAGKMISGISAETPKSFAYHGSISSNSFL
eukprot:s3349_g4.t1